MNNTKKFKILTAAVAAKFFLILTTGIFFASCNKPTDIGLDVQPPNDMLNVGIDSTALITKTVREDSLRTDQVGYSGTGLIGKYIDPVFGEATSSLYTKLVLYEPRTFDTIPVCDSVVLSLVYTGVPYPKKIKAKQTVNVFRLTEEIKTESPYYSHSKVAVQAKDLANGFSFTPAPTDSVKIKVGQQKLKPQVRIRLEKTFGEEILKSGKLSSNTDFQAYLKGLHITTANTPGLLPNDGNILNFSIAESKLIIYHHGLKTDSILYMSFGEARFSNFTHAYATTAAPDINLQLNATAQTQNDITYLQCMSGLKTRIEIPAIKQDLAKHGSLGINRAQLVIKVIRESLKDSFAVPPTLILYGISDQGKAYLLPDALENDTYFGGTYDKYEYRFNIARYVQQLLLGEQKNNGLFLVSSAAVINANRVLIGGGGSGGAAGNPYQMKLYITYTK